MYKLLIVDDEPLVRRGIKSLVDFSKLNISEVYEAANGEEAKEIFSKKSPHLILADINMPKVDGLTFAKYVKNENTDTKIAIITGYDYFDYAIQALKLGVDDYILKPVSKNDVMELLRRLIIKIEDDLEKNEVENAVSEIRKELDINNENSQAESIQKILDREIYNPNFSLKALSSELGYSSGYLSGQFKKIYGITFQDYLVKTRMEKGKILLLTTSLKNYEIAEKIGFTDVNYFSTSFKKQFGESPKVYKERVKFGDETV